MHDKNCKLPSCKNSTWMTREQITKAVKKRNNWVWGKLDQYRTDERFCQKLPHTHKAKQTPYFPPCVLTALRIEAYSIIPPANGWLTESEIAKKLKVTWRMVKKLLAPYLAMAELRRDSRNRTRWHYSPTIIQSL